MMRRLTEKKMVTLLNAVGEGDWGGKAYLKKICGDVNERGRGESGKPPGTAYNNKGRNKRWGE